MNESIDQEKPIIETCPQAAWSLGLAITGLVLILIMWPVFTIPAVICGHVGLSKIKKSTGALTGKMLAVAGLIVGYTVLALQIGMVMTAFSLAREGARRIKCTGNLHQIGKACLMYANDYGEQFPPSLHSLSEKYVVDTKLFVCPSNHKKPGAMSDVNTWADYVFVPNLTTLDSPDSVIAFCKPGHDGEGGNILKVDGTAEWHTEPRYSELTGHLLKQSDP